jgi:hypothetical protein
MLLMPYDGGEDGYRNRNGCDRKGGIFSVLE